MEHALSAITVLGIVLGVTLSLIPDDFFGKKNSKFRDFTQTNIYLKVVKIILVPLHAELLQIIADHVHYIPQDWLKDPRSAKTQKFFSQLYQVKSGRIRLENFSSNSQYILDEIELYYRRIIISNRNTIYFDI